MNLNAPTLSAATPADDTSAVAVDSNIVLTFSASMVFGSGAITISDGYTQTYLDKSGLLQTRWVGASDTRVLSISDPQVTISGNTATINLSQDLQAGRTYNVLIDNGFFKNSSNVAYAGIASSGKLNFTTAGTLAAPTAQIGNSIVFDDSGVSSSDYITHTASVQGTYSGTLGAHDMVQVSLDSGASWQVASATAGSWSYVGAPGADGSYSAIARVINTAGQSTGSVSHSYTYDSSAPSADASISDNVLGVGETAVVTITFTEAVYNFTLLNSTTHSATYGTFTSADGGYHWSATVTPNANTQANPVQDSLVISATDAAGNAVSNSLLQVPAYAVNTQTLPAVVVAISHLSNDSGSSGSDFITSTASQLISGGLDGSLPVGIDVQVSLDGSNWATAVVDNNTHTWSLASNVTLSSGSHTIYARLSDGVNSSTPVTHSYTLDSTAPQLQSTTLGSNSIVLTFNEDVAASTHAFFTLTDSSNNAMQIGVENSLVSVNGHSITLSLPSALSNSTHYSLDMDGGTVTDLAGNVVYSNLDHLLDLSTDGSGNLQQASHLIASATSAFNATSTSISGQYVSISGNDKVQVYDGSNWNTVSDAAVSGTIRSWSATIPTQSSIVQVRLVDSNNTPLQYLTDGNSTITFGASEASLTTAITDLGSNSIIFGGSGATVIQAGAYAHITTGSGTTTVVADDYADIVSNGPGSVTVDDHASVVLNGSGSTLLSTGSNLNLITNNGSHSIVLGALDSGSHITANGSNDTLNFNFSATFSLNGLANTYHMSGIEILNLLTSGSDLTIGSTADVLALAGGHTLFLAGDVANTVHIDGAQWTTASGINGYAHYVGINDSSVHLYIASGMGQTL